jgi:ApbE superfamily uncharacterized protein (UPF0280 family)
MTQSQNINVEINSDLDEELEKIEEEITSHKKTIEDLTWRRSELLTKKQDLEICELIDCIFEKGMSTNEALEILNGVEYLRRTFVRI